MNNASSLFITSTKNISVSGLLAIQRLRYRVYCEEMGLQVPAMDRERKLLPDPLDQPAIHICATVEGELSGAVRLNTNTVPYGLEDVLETRSLPRPFVYCARLFIVRERRGPELMNRLSRACFLQFAEEGAAAAICHCYAPLVNLYRRMGFRPYGIPFTLPGLEELGLQTPLICAPIERQAPKAA